VLAITVYSDPVPAEIIVSNPMQQDFYVNEERDEQSEFQEILAGIMNAESSQTPESDSSQNALTLEKTHEGSKLNIFTNEADKILAEDMIAEISAKIDTVLGEGMEIDAAAESDLAGLISARQANYGDSDTEIESETLSENFTQDFDVQSLDDSAKLASITKNEVKPEAAKENISADASVISEKVKTDPAAQTNAAAETAQIAKRAEKNSDDAAASLADKKGAKDSQSGAEDVKVFTKNEKTEPVSGGKTENDAQQTVRQNETPGKLDEHRSRLRKEKVSVEVQDFRTNTSSQTSAANTAALGETARAAGPVQEVTLDLSLGDIARHNSQAQVSWDAKSGAAMENLLARELHQNFNGDIVRHAQMILRNGGEGIIRLALHPETLGNVKIHLEMAENKITGHIFVESEESLNAFRREIAALEQAFKDSGFAEATLDLSMSDNGARNQEHENPGFFAMDAASSYEESYDARTSPVIDVFFGRRSGQVNMLA